MNKKNAPTPLKILKKILSLDEFISYLGIIILIVCTLACVVARYVFNSPLHWGEELQILCMIQIVFWGGSCVIRNGGLTRVDIILELMPPKMRKVAEIFIDLISFSIFGFIFINGYKMVRNLFKIGRPMVMMPIPLWLVYICIPISCVLMFLNTILIRVWPQYFDNTYVEEAEEE